MNSPLAILTADWHMSHVAPACRAERTTAEWYSTQANYIGQVRDLCNNLKAPLLIAGDLFDRPDNPAELVNFIIREFAQFKHYVFAVPGQHDLFHHALVDIKRTSYWTLVESASILNLSQDKPGGYRGLPLSLYGYAWGLDPPQELPLRFHPDGTPDTDPKIAVTHRYVWTAKPNTGHPLAEGHSELGQQYQKFRQFDVVLSGDNHLFFYVHNKELRPTSWFNSGSFLIRKMDEMKHRPCVGILYSDGTVKSHYLDTSKDQFVVAPEGTEAVGLDPEELLKELRGLGDKAIDFGAALRRLSARKGVTEGVRDAVIKCLEEQK